MKSSAISCAVLAVLLALSLWNGWWLTQRCEDWAAQLGGIDALAAQDDWETAAEALEALYGHWQQVQPWLHITMEHDVLNQAETLFCRAAVLAEEEDSVEFRAHIADLTSALQLLSEMEQLRLENVL